MNQELFGKQGLKTAGLNTSVVSFHFFIFIFLPHYMTCRTLVPQPGIEPMSTALEAQNLTLTTGPPGRSLLSSPLFYTFSHLSHPHLLNPFLEFIETLFCLYQNMRGVTQNSETGVSFL